MPPQEPKGPWGKRNDEIDELRSKEILAGIDDAGFIEQMLQGIRQQLVDAAKQSGIKFQTLYKTGIPGIATILEREGDLSMLVPRAQEIVEKENASLAVRNKGISFDVSFVPKKQDTDAALIITGWTGRKS